jgi:hypothetical protein
MDRSRRLKDGTRWRIFMRLLRLDDLMTSYTNARPGAGLRTPRVTARRTSPDVARLGYQLDRSRHAVSLWGPSKLRRHSTTQKQFGHSRRTIPERKPGCELRRLVCRSLNRGPRRKRKHGWGKQGDSQAGDSKRVDFINCTSTIPLSTARLLMPRRRQTIHSQVLHHLAVMVEGVGDAESREMDASRFAVLGDLQHIFRGQCGRGFVAQGK